jgi:hypothetical protein
MSMDTTSCCELGTGKLYPYFLLKLKNKKCNWENDKNKYYSRPITSGNASCKVFLSH